MVECKEEKEILHRAIKPRPQFWNTKEGRVTSALFKDSKGVSVDKNGGRKEKDIKESFLSNFPDLLGEARVGVALCWQNQCVVFDDPLQNNQYHALICGKDKIELTKGQARVLALNATLVTYY